MVRILLAYIVPLLLPLAAWLIWYRYFARPGPEKGLGLREAPYHWLGLAGVVLVAAVLGSIAIFGGDRPGEIYEPPRVIDGKIVPGRSRPAEPRN